MPLKVTNQYVFSGPVEVTIYTEHEMATVLELTRDELRRAISEGKYTYHVHPDAEGSGTRGYYQFTKRCYLDNIARKVEGDRASRSSA